MGVIIGYSATTIILNHHKKIKKTKINSTGFYKRILPSLSDEEARELERIEDNLKVAMATFAKKTLI